MNYKIYVADLAEYNAGNLVGQWFDLDEYSEPEKLLVAINKMLNGHEEFAIHDYELPFDIGEYTPLSEIYETIEIIEDNGTLALAIIEAHGYEELTNISCYILSPPMNEGELGYYLLEQMVIPEFLEDFIDYQKYGRDASFNGIFTAYGFLE